MGLWFIIGNVEWIYRLFNEDSFILYFLEVFNPAVSQAVVMAFCSMSNRTFESST